MFLFFSSKMKLCDFQSTGETKEPNRALEINRLGPQSTTW